MPPLNLTVSQRLKVEALGGGIRLTPAADAAVRTGGRPISLFEYPTTAGVTLEIPGAGYVNAPFHGAFAAQAEVQLDCDRAGQFSLSWRGNVLPVQVLPLPGYIDRRLPGGALVSDLVMSHADRMRLSPVYGCAYRCHFCDWPNQSYHVRPAEILLEAADVAMGDKVLPVRHALISGGTPAECDRGSTYAAVAELLTRIPLPTDVMFAPHGEDTTYVDDLVRWGAAGMAINIELFDEMSARRLTPQKYAGGRKAFDLAIRRAVELTGGEGRVRSLLLVGLEDVESTLAGVRWLAERGCDPVLSPFRPADGTALATYPPPTPEILLQVLCEAMEIAARYGVKIGPRCVPCQHNCLVTTETPARRELLA